MVAWALVLTPALALPATAGAASSAALTRYDSPAGHWVTTGPVTSGYSVEGTLGFLSEASVAGTTPLYGCGVGSGHFLSLNSSCEGQTVLRTEGWIYTSPPSGLASSPIYRCRDGSDHFAATSSGCEGQVDEGLLGYALDSAPLNRYNGGAHWVTTGAPPSGYALEGTLGYLVLGEAGGPTEPLYGCEASGGGQFLALDAGCEGMTTLDVEGWIYPSAPAGTGSSPIYRCRDGSDHFAATDPGCEGQVTEGLLGYALQSPLTPPPPTTSPTPNPGPPASSAPVATPIPEPAPARHHRAVRVRIVLTWTWQGATTRLTRARIGRLPKGASIRVSCQGPGPACEARATVAGVRRVRRLATSLDGRIYSAGDRLVVLVSKRGYEPERAVIRIRYGRVPAVRR
jgi:hypothetical protein